MTTDYGYRIGAATLTVNYLRVAYKDYRGEIAVDGNVAYTCGHVHHSKWTAKQCARKTRQWLRRLTEGNPRTIERLENNLPEPPWARQNTSRLTRERAQLAH